MDKADLQAQFDRESAYFVAHQDELLEHFPDQWVAIYGERVVAAAPSFDALLAELRAQGIPPGRAFKELMETQPKVLIV